MCACICEWFLGSVCIYGWMNGWTDGWADRWMDGWMRAVCYLHMLL